jgi:hypothetical protein
MIIIAGYSSKDDDPEEDAECGHEKKRSFHLTKFNRRNRHPRVAGKWRVLSYEKTNPWAFWSTRTVPRTMARSCRFSGLSPAQTSRSQDSPHAAERRSFRVSPRGRREPVRLNT